MVLIGKLLVKRISLAAVIRMYACPVIMMEPDNNLFLTSSNQHTMCCVCPCRSRNGRSLGKPNSHY